MQLSLFTGLLCLLPVLSLNRLTNSYKNNFNENTLLLRRKSEPRRYEKRDTYNKISSFKNNAYLDLKPSLLKTEKEPFSHETNNLFSLFSKNKGENINSNINNALNSKLSIFHDDKKTLDDSSNGIPEHKYEIANGKDLILNRGVSELENSRLFTPSPARRDVEVPILRSKRKKKREKKKKRKRSSESSESDERMKTPSWKQEWKKKWIQQKEQFDNKSTTERGDVVNMAAARPWGVPCGDPNQHDMPWGSCMLSMECESEYRIYRGDLFCGRTEFVCCALQLHTYDIYEAIDLDLESEDTDTGKKKKESSKGKERLRKKKEKKTRKRNRRKRKKKMRRRIKKLLRDMQKKLRQVSQNNTQQFKDNQNRLKKILQEQKKQARKERQREQDLQATLQEKEEEKILHDMEARFQNISQNVGIAAGIRANDGASNAKTKTRRRSEYLDYDIEYGLLYL